MKKTLLTFIFMLGLTALVKGETKYTATMSGVT